MAVGHLVGAAIMVALAVVVVMATLRGRRWYRYSPQIAREVGWSPGEPAAESAGWLSRPTTWIAAFFLVGTLSVAGVFLFATGTGSAGMSTALLGAVGALIVVYLVGGIYLMARGRGHSSAMAVAESLTVSGVVFLALVTIQLVALG